MRKMKWIYWGLFGFVFGVLRGLLEVIRLNAEYPLNTSTGVFAVQTAFMYGVFTAFAGVIPAFFIWILFNKKTYGYLLVPAGYLIVLIIVDVLGMKTPIPFTCRVTQGMPPRYSAGDNPADLLIVTLDTFRADYAGVYGNSYVRTPAIDRLAQSGISIMDAIAPIPITTSSHATIFTGLDPPEHGSRFNAVPIGPETRTMAEVFRDHGYHTGAFVSAFPVTLEVSGLARGFDVYDQLLTPSRLHPMIYRTTLVRGLTQYGAFRPAARRWFRVLPPVFRWWSLAGESPRFTWVHMFDPHFPYKPGFPFDPMYLYRKPEFDQCVFDIADINRRGISPSQEKKDEFIMRYAGEVTAVDTAIEKLIRALQKENRFDTTCIIITADHGESLDEHGYYFSHGDNVLDPSLRVPLVARYPRIIPENRLVSGQMRLASLAGTVYKVMGVSEAHVNLPENNVYMAWTGEVDSIQEDFAYSESGSGVYTKVHVPSVDRIRGKQRSIRSDYYKVVFVSDTVQIGYNLETDPAETNPLPIYSNNTLISMAEKLADYILKFDAYGSPPPDIPDESVLKQLQMLGYID